MAGSGVHYGRPHIGFGGFYMRCELIVMVEERWTMNKRIVTCAECLKMLEVEKAVARAYAAEFVA